VVVISESLAINAERPEKAGKRRGAVQIKGRGTDVAFNLDEDAPLEQVARELDAQLAGQSALFSKGGISVNTGNRCLSDDEEEEIRRIFREKSGLQISRFISSTGQVLEPPKIELEKPPVEPTVRRTKRSSSPPPQLSSADLARALSGLSSQGQRNRDRALIVRGTVRSGESVQHSGDLVVLGDVNPGSEVLADGDIVVMGALKGLPHAGASGDNKAAIIALEIASPRLRIGKIDADAPPSENSRGSSKNKSDSEASKPMIAYVRSEIIYVSPFVGRFARYTKGVPYER
jgi:septum site-determining protein MinC